jgi:hypothetical protein
MKEFTLFNGAAKIIGAGLSTVEVEISDKALIIGAGIVVIGVCSYLLYNKFKKVRKKKQEKCTINGCRNTPTESSCPECSHTDVQGIILLSDGFIGIQKDSYFFFTDSEIFNENLPQINFTEFGFFQVSPSLHKVGKKCPKLQKYWASHLSKAPLLRNPDIDIKLNDFIIVNQKVLPFFSNKLCLSCKKKLAHYLKHKPEDLPVNSYLVNAIKRFKK